LAGFVSSKPRLRPNSSACVNTVAQRRIQPVLRPEALNAAISELQLRCNQFCFLSSPVDPTRHPAPFPGDRVTGNLDVDPPHAIGDRVYTTRALLAPARLLPAGILRATALAA
jgi:hypothetical protein